MIKKSIRRLLMPALFFISLNSCIHDDVTSVSDPVLKEYANKSLWKEDEKYIKNVMKVYWENEDKIKKTTGTPYWDYASTLESFDESFLMVPVVESGKVVSVIQVPRHGSRIRFYYTNFKNQLDFFQDLVFASYKKAVPSDASSETDKTIVCKTVTVSVWLPDSESNPDPGSGAGHWGTHSVIKCKQVLDNCSGVVGPDGQCITGGSGENPIDFPYPGGGGGTTETPEDPCEKAQASMAGADAVFKNTNVKTKMDAVLKGKISAPKEWSVALGQKPDGSYEVTSPKEGTPTSVLPPFENLANPPIGSAHSHAGAFGNPSAGDLYSLLERMASYPNIRYSFVYGVADGNSEIYSLVIDDSALAAGFLLQYPKSENYDPVTHDIKDKSKLGKESDKMKYMYAYNSSGNTSGENYNKGAVAMAYILEKFNSGVSIAKADAGGNLKKINASVQTTVKPNGIIEEKPVISKCP